MGAIEKGKNVIITKGSNAGKKASVVEIIDKTRIKIRLETGKEVLISPKHVEPS